MSHNPVTDVLSLKEEGNLDTEGRIHEEEGHVTTDAVIGVM